LATLDKLAVKEFKGIGFRHIHAFNLVLLWKQNDQPRLYMVSKMKLHDLIFSQKV